MTDPKLIKPLYGLIPVTDLNLFDLPECHGIQEIEVRTAITHYEKIAILCYPPAFSVVRKLLN